MVTGSGGTGQSDRTRGLPRAAAEWAAAGLKTGIGESVFARQMGENLPRRRPQRPAR
jgi:hypothetical protein